MCTDLHGEDWKQNKRYANYQTRHACAANASYHTTHK